jgi:ankyrin repeat protein
MFDLFCSTDENNHNLLEHAAIINNRFLCSYIIRNVKTIKLAKLINLDRAVEVAITNSTEDIVMLMVDHLINIKANEKALEHYMDECINNKKMRVVRMLLMLGADPNHVDSSGRSLLYNVVSIGDDYLLDVLIDHYHVNVNCLDENGINVIFFAIHNNNTKLSSAMIMSGMHLDCTDSYGKTLIEVCVSKNWYLHVNYLLKKKHFPFCDDDALFHKLCHFAVRNNSTIIFNKLLVSYCAVKIQRYWRKSKNRS